VLDEQGDLVERWDWLADPGIEIPEGAAAVHGITTERAQALGRPAHLVVAEITQTLRVLLGLGMPLVVYNAPYDLSLLDRECRRHGLAPLDDPQPVIDPLVLDKAVDKYRKGKRTLVVTAERYGVTLDDAHDAGSDAIAAGRVALALQRAYPEELDVAAADLHERQTLWYAEQAASFQDYIRRVKGDDAFVADTGWPVRLSDDPGAFVDTQPIPRPEPRPSLTVPVFDLYGTGTLSLTSAPAQKRSAYASAPPPTLIPASSRDEEDEPSEQLQLAPEPSILPEAAVPDDSETLPVKRPAVLRVAAGIVTDAAGRTLLVRKVGSTAFMQAGGEIESGESALDALARELREEIGHEVDLDRTEYIGSYRAVAANEHDTVIRAEVFALSVDSEIVASGEIEEILWIDSPEPEGIELAPLTRDTILPIWVQRRSTLF